MSLSYYLVEATRQEALAIQTELLELLPDSIDIAILSDDLTSTYKLIFLRASKGTRDIDIKWVTGNRVFTITRHFEVENNSHGYNTLRSIATVKSLAEILIDELEEQ